MENGVKHNSIIVYGVKSRYFFKIESTKKYIMANILDKLKEILLNKIS